MITGTVVVIFIVAVASCAEVQIVPENNELLGEIKQLSSEALKSDEAKTRVESALKHLEARDERQWNYRLINILNGTNQVVNGIKFVFEAEVKRTEAEKQTLEAEGASEVYRINIYQPAALDAQIEYAFERLSPKEQ